MEILISSFVIAGLLFECTRRNNTPTNIPTNTPIGQDERLGWILCGLWLGMLEKENEDA